MLEKKYLSRVTTAVLLGLCASGQAFAAEENKKEEQNKGLEIIEVTAQKRTESVQEVPIAISAFSDSDIAKVGAANINDLGLLTPGLETNNATATQTTFNIRGITTNDFGIGLDAAVAVYVDGVYVGRRGTSNLNFNDIDRVEILKGPQGTLFGRNSSAGAIHIISKEATSDNEGSVKFTFGSHEKRKVELSTNFAINEDMNFRGGLVANERGGYLDQANEKEKYGNQKDWSLRGSLFWDYDDKTDVVFRADFSHLNQESRPSVSLNPGYFAPADPFAPIESDYDGREKRKVAGLSAEVNYDMGDDMTFTSISAFRQFTRYNGMEDDGSAFNRASFASVLDEDQRQFSQEFRLTQNKEDFKWTLGATLFREDIQQTTEALFTTATLDALAIVQLQSISPEQAPFLGLDPALVGPNANPANINSAMWPPGFGTSIVYANTIPQQTLGGIIANTGLSLEQVMASIVGANYYKDHREVFENESITNSAAIYFDGTYSLTDKLDVTIGARYTYDEKEFDLHSEPTNVISMPFPGVDDIPLSIAFIPQTAHQEADWSKFTPRFVLDYQWTDDVMTYASYSEGFKAGGFNTLGEAPPVAEETVKNSEVGLKSTWLDNRLKLNLSAYKYDYTNLQQHELIAAEGSSVPTYNLRNVDAEGQGFDVEFVWQATDDLMLTMNYGKVETEYTKWQFFDFENPATTESRVGESISGMPEDQANARLDYYFEGMNGEFNFHLSYSYTGDRTQGIDGPTLNPLPYNPANITGLNADNTISSYSLVNTRLTWESDIHPISLAFFVSNLTDEEYLLQIGGQAMAVGSPIATPGLPRMWGVEFGMQF